MARNGNSRTVELKSGGQLTFTLEARMPLLSARDRALVDSVITVIDDYERTPAGADDGPGSVPADMAAAVAPVAG